MPIRTTSLTASTTRASRGPATRTCSTCCESSTPTTRQKFAKLVGMLDGIQNGDGSTLLDSSAAVWFQDCVGRLRPQPEQPSRSFRRAAAAAPSRRAGPSTSIRAARGREPDPGQQRGAVRARRQRHGQRPQQGNGNRSEAGQRANQQILLQPHERDGREGGCERIPHGGRQRGGDAVRLLRPDDGLLRRLRRGRGRWSPRPRRVHGPQSHPDRARHPPARVGAAGVREVSCPRLRAGAARSSPRRRGRSRR